MPNYYKPSIALFYGFFVATSVAVSAITALCSIFLHFSVLGWILLTIVTLAVQQYVTLIIFLFSTPNPWYWFKNPKNTVLIEETLDPNKYLTWCRYNCQHRYKLTTRHRITSGKPLYYGISFEQKTDAVMFTLYKDLI